jgi:hypothetical protein
MKRFTFSLAGTVLCIVLLAGCNHDTDQISTESPSTRHSTADNPDSSSIVTDSTALLR